MLSQMQIDLSIANDYFPNLIQLKRLMCSEINE